MQRTHPNTVEVCGAAGELRLPILSAVDLLKGIAVTTALRRGIAAAACSLALVATAIVPAHAETFATNAESANAAANYIKSTWEGTENHGTDAGFLADQLIALASANKHQGTVLDILDEFKVHAGTYASGPVNGGLGKVVLTASVLNQNPNTFLSCDRNVLQELRDQVANQDNRVKRVWGPAITIIALSRTDGAVPTWLVDHLISTQLPNGGFKIFGNSADPDSTGLAISALGMIRNNPGNSAEDKAKAEASLTKAIAWTNDSRIGGDGGHYWDIGGGYSAANTTGMIAGGLAEVGQNIESAAAAMRTQQGFTGVGAWAATRTTNGEPTTTPNLRSTTQAIFAVTGKAYGLASMAIPEQSNCGVSNTTTTFNLDKASVKLGDTVTATGTVSSKIAGTTVWLQRQDANGNWLPVASAATNANGSYSIPAVVRVKGSVSFRVSAAANGAWQPSVSIVREVDVDVTSTTTTATISPASVQLNGAITATGKVTPAAADLTVWLQRQGSNGAWLNVASGKTTANGSYRINAVARVLGDIPFRVSLNAQGSYSASTSAEKTIKVTSVAPTNTWREGWCAAGEGQSVVVDWNGVSDANPIDNTDGNSYLVRCIPITTEGQYPVEASSSTANPLASAGISYEAQNGIVTSVNGIDAPADYTQWYWHVADGTIAGWGTGFQPTASTDSFFSYTAGGDDSQPSVTPVFLTPAKSTTTFSVAPATVALGGNLNVTGRVSPDVEGAVVWLQRQNAAGNWLPVAGSTTKANGSFGFTAKASVAGTISYRISTAKTFTTTASTSTSRAVTVTQATKTTHVMPTTGKLNQTVTVTGKVTPGISGQPVWLQRRDASGKWLPVVKVTTNASGNVTFKTVLRVKGTVGYRLSTATHGHNGPSVSPLRNVVVS